MREHNLPHSLIPPFPDSLVLLLSFPLSPPRPGDHLSRVSAILTFWALLIYAARVVFLGAAVVIAVVCLLDWLVRTRRLSPFGGIARFTRRAVDPLLAPVERSVLRAGGSPASVPWWGLVAVVVGGIIVISVLQFVYAQLVGLMAAAQGGPRGLLRFLLAATFAVLQIALLVRVFSSWFPISPYSRWIRWAYTLSEPILRPLRQFIPPFGPLDLTPLIAYFLIRIVGGFIVGAI